MTAALCAPGCKLKLEGETVTGACTVRLNVAAVAPTLEIVRVFLMGNALAAIAPKARVGGFTAAATATASPALSLPAPAEFTRAVAPLGSVTS